MITIKNKSTSIEPTGGKSMSYLDLCLICLDNIPREGIDRKEMKARDKAESNLIEGEELTFEDAEFETLKFCVSEMKWAMRHVELTEFLDYIYTMETN